MDLSEIDYRIWLGLTVLVGVIAMLTLVIRARRRRQRQAGSGSGDPAGAVTLRMHRVNRPSAEPLPDPPWYTGPPSFPPHRSAPSGPPREAAPPAVLPPLISSGAKEETRPMRSIEYDEAAADRTDYSSFQYDHLIPPPPDDVESDEQEPPAP